MSSVQAAGEAFQAWLKDATDKGMLPFGAVKRETMVHFARSAAFITPNEVTQQVPMLAPYADEIVALLRKASGVTISTSASGQGAPAPPSQPVHDAPPAQAVRFAPYTGGIPGEAVENALSELQPNGTIRYAWPALDDTSGSTLYRVVTSDTARPLSPEDGRVLGPTSDRSMVDPRAHVGVNRFVQVWVNQGADASTAASAQPMLWAETTVGAPVRNFAASWDHGAVVARWETVAGVERVRVYRIPSELNEDVLAHELDLYAVQPEAIHLHGLVDTEVERGKEYVYRIVTESNGTWSPPVEIPITPPPEARGVGDLKATILQQPTTDTAGAVSLEWTQPPSGKVVIYRSESSPPPGLVGKVVSQATLAGTGLTTLVPNSPEPTDQVGFFRMSNVRWPEGWTSAYFLPVTVMGDEVLPGQHVRVTGVPVPRRPELAHRGEVQVVSFGWPEGAGTVRVHLAPRNSEPAAVVQGRPRLEVDRERYIKDGGIRLAHPSAQPADVILTAWVTGETSSAPVVVPLESRLTIHYSLEAQKWLRVGPIKHARVVVWSDQKVRSGAPQFVVVHNPERLPLHAEDGEALAVVPDETPDATPQRAFSPPSLSGGPQGAAYRALAPKQAKGYVRVFVAPQISEQVRRRIILLDPPVSSLIWK